MAGERASFFNIEDSYLAHTVERRHIEDGRVGVVCTVNFELGNEVKYLTFLLVSPENVKAIRLDRVEGGGPIPGNIVGLVRDFAKIQVAKFLSGR